MTGEEIIVTFKEPWYNDYTRRLYTQLSEQMNKEKYGKKYCPCSLVREDDTVCMCKEFRERNLSLSIIH